MSPDGHWIIIKNYDCTEKFPSNFVDENLRGKSKGEFAYALIWERKDGESVVEALNRQPQQISAYIMEWQGEAVAWLDSTTFYTTSDEDGSAPIYKYVRWDSADLTSIQESNREGAVKVLIGNSLFIRTKENDYSFIGQRL